MPAFRALETFLRGGRIIGLPGDAPRPVPLPGTDQPVHPVGGDFRAELKRAPLHGMSSRQNAAPWAWFYTGPFGGAVRQVPISASGARRSAPQAIREGDDVRQFGGNLLSILIIIC